MYLHFYQLAGSRAVLQVQLKTAVGPNEGRTRDKHFRWNMNYTLWIQTVFYAFLLEISLFLMFKSTLKVLIANSIRTISRAISSGAINYFSLFGEQMSLSYAELI